MSAYDNYTRDGLIKGGQHYQDGTTTTDVIYHGFAIGGLDDDVAQWAIFIEDSRDTYKKDYWAEDEEKYNKVWDDREDYLRAI